MRLTVVGCAGSYPSAASPASCYLIEHDGHRILLDLGNGSLGALQQHIDLTWPGALDAVVLSHCHLDHCADLGSLYVQRHYAPAPALDRLPVLGPSDARSRAIAIYGKADDNGLDEQFDFVTFPREALTIGPFTVTAARAAHPVEAYSVRVTAGGRSLTYSGDTGPNDRLVDLAEGSDLALFEASFVGTSNPPDLHMSGADAARMARASGVGRLVLTHHAAWNDPAVVLAEAVAEWDGPIEQAAPGMTLDV
jgi:ribonuclease BN (tRNA processing enzyme)